MKTLFLFIIIALISCKKDNQGRIVEIYAINYSCTGTETHESGSMTVRNSIDIKANSMITFQTQTGTHHLIHLESKTFINHQYGYRNNDDFSLKVVENGKVIYHKDGWSHDIKL